MAEKGETKINRKIVSIIIILIIIFSIGYIIWDQFENRSNISFRYSININPDNNDNYSLILPIPVNYEGYPEPILNTSISDITKFIKITRGNGEFKIITTKFGYGIRINGSGELNLESKGNSKLDINTVGDGISVCLSMKNDSNKDGKYLEDEHRCYNNRPNEIHISIKLYIHWVNKLGNETLLDYIIEEDIINNWQTLNGEDRGYIE